MDELLVECAKGDNIPIENLNNKLIAYPNDLIIMGQSITESQELLDRATNVLADRGLQINTYNCTALATVLIPA